MVAPPIRLPAPAPGGLTMIVGSIIRQAEVARISFRLTDYHTHPSRTWVIVQATCNLTRDTPAREALRQALLAALEELGPAPEG
jgi:hypothetical protein